MRSFLTVVVAALMVVNAFASELPFDYRAMSDWPKLCNQGKQQSPINIYTKEVTISSDKLQTMEFKTMGTLEKYVVMFTGTCLQVTFKDWSVETDVKIPANEYHIGNSTEVKEGQLLAIEPIQMHIHTLSEHTLDGFYAPGELHIVTKVRDGESDYCDTIEGGCIAVFAVLLTYERHGNKNNHVLKEMFDKMPPGTGEKDGVHHKTKLDLDELIPEDRDYFLYKGSYTTPPCTEVVTWHVFAEPVDIAAELIQQHQHMVSFTQGEDCTFNYHGYCSPPREKTNYRPIQRHMGRDVYLIRAEMSLCRWNYLESLVSYLKVNRR